MPPALPSLESIESRLSEIRVDVRHTPVVSMPAEALMPDGSSTGQLSFKLESLQHAGSFKARGTVIALNALDEASRKRGVVAVSAGNHAIATAYAAARRNSHAVVVMMKNANPLRVSRCKALGARIELAENVHEAFERCRTIAENEGRTLLHPFESPNMVLGSSTLGVEFARDLEAGGAAPLDAAIIPIGGGGLAAGMAHGLKSVFPDIKIYGVEPVGADSMTRSFSAGEPQKIDKVATIADSLGAPFALPMTYGICRHYLEDIVRIDDTQLVEGMELLLEHLKLAVEPAGAAATAAMMGPLRDTLQGRHVGLIVCGANIDARSFARYLS